MAPPPSTNTVPLPTIVLSGNTLSKFKPAKIFKGAVDAVQPPTPGSQASRQPHPAPRSITGITFDDRGDQLVTAGDDETFRLYGCKTGKVMKTLNSKKYGIDLPRFTHKNSAIIYASTKEDDTIRYHSLHDNKYLQYFKGHKDRVISLEVAPQNDEFISGSLDKTARLWDLRTPVCRGLVPTPVPPIVAYDPQGVIFAVGINSYAKILVYDSSNYDAGPFMTCKLEDPTLKQISFPPREIYLTSISFASTGRFILAGCSGNAHYVLDAYQGAVIAKLEGHIGLERKSMQNPPNIDPAPGISREEVSWTPDSKFIVGGSLDGRIFIWDVQHLRPLDPPPPSDDGSNPRPTFPPMRIQPLSILEGHPGPSRCVKFNPRFAMMATAGTELAFWLPDPTADADEVAKELLKKKGFPSA